MIQERRRPDGGTAEKPELVEGTVSSLIFQNEENGYTILRLDVGGEEVTVVGAMPGVSPGEYLSVRGRWVRHATYGAQFKAEMVERRLPQGLKEVYHYLASGAVKGVGKATARLLVEEFGEDALTVIEEEPEKLTKIQGHLPQAGPADQRRLPPADGDAAADGVSGRAPAAPGAGRPPVPGLRGRGAGGAAGQPLSAGGGGVRGGVLPGGRPGPGPGGGGGGPPAAGGGAAL